MLFQILKPSQEGLYYIRKETHAWFQFAGCKGAGFESYVDRKVLVSSNRAHETYTFLRESLSEEKLPNI